MQESHILHSFIASNHPNSILLRKICAAVALGPLEINGQMPDDKLPLSQYILNQEPILFDFRRLHPDKIIKFKNWLLKHHLNQAENQYFYHNTLKDNRGYPITKKLNYLQRLWHWIWKSNPSYHWELAPLEITLSTQLKGINLIDSDQGMLVEFEQLGHFASPNQYGMHENPYKLIGNAVRIMLTNEAVDSIIGQNLSKNEINTYIDSPHQYSIPIDTDKEFSRYQKMNEYRIYSYLITQSPWYAKIWYGIKVFFINLLGFFITQDEVKKPVIHEVVLNPHNTLDVISRDTSQSKEIAIVFQNEKILIFIDNITKECVVYERRKPVDTIVYCGGGPKIHAHVGVLKYFDEKGFKFKNFSGTSAGAIFATLCAFGYNAEDCSEFFKHFDGSKLVHFSFLRRLYNKFMGYPNTEISDSIVSGASDSIGLKNVISRAILEKIQPYLRTDPIPQQGITFAYLHHLHEKYPDEFAASLVIVATNITSQKADYFSYETTPDVLIADAVTASAALWPIYGQVLINGQAYIDGGFSSNLPVEYQKGKDNSLLRSDFNIPELIAIQFENGTEGSALHQLKDVYEEGGLISWIIRKLYGFSKGIKGFVLDRVKIQLGIPRQTIIVDAPVSTSRFSLKPEEIKLLRDNGYKAVKDYFDSAGLNANQIESELKMERFFSIEAFICYLIITKNIEILKKVKDSLQQDKSDKYLKVIRQIDNYLSQEKNRIITTLVPELKRGQSDLSYFLQQRHTQLTTVRNYALYNLLGPLLEVLPLNSMDTKARVLSKKMINHLDPLNPLSSILGILKEFRGQEHLFFHLFKNILENKDNVNATNDLKNIEKLFKNIDKFNDKKYLGNWSISYQHSIDLVDKFNQYISTNNSQILNQIDTMLKQYRQSSLRISGLWGRCREYIDLAIHPIVSCVEDLSI